MHVHTETYADIIIFVVSEILLHKFESGGGGGEHLFGHERDPFLTGNYF